MFDSVLGIGVPTCCSRTLLDLSGYEKELASTGSALSFLETELWASLSARHVAVDAVLLVCDRLLETHPGKFDPVFLSVYPLSSFLSLRYFPTFLLKHTTLFIQRGIPTR